MSKNCLNCGCEISGEGKNKIFCDECLLKISPFLKFVSKSPTSAVKLFELNSPKLRAQGLSEDAIRYIEKCCTRYDEKHAASAAAAAAATTAAAAAAQNAPIHNESAHINESEPNAASVSEASEVDASIFGAVNLNESVEDESSNTANIEMNILAALGGAAAMGSIGNDDAAAAAAAASAAAQTGGISLEGLNPDNAISGSLNTRETAAVSAGVAAASHAASHAASRTGSGGSGGGGKPPHNEDDFDDGDTQQSDDKKRVYIILIVAAIALVLFLIIFIASSDRENGDSETTTDADNTLISTDESSYDYGDVSTDEGTYTDGTSADGTSDDGTSADESTSEDESTSAGENTSGEVTTTEAEATATTADETTTAAPDETTANATTYYTVSFNLNYTGATGTPASQEVESGSTAAAPTSPTRTGYTFLGWYTSRTGNTEYSFSSAVTANITLYAHWSADTYTVTFNSNGGSSVSSQTVSYGLSAAKPTDPTRDGYTFLGWYTSSTGGTEYSFSSSVTSSFTLYAHWAEQTAAIYTVSFDMNYPSGFSGASNVPSSQTVEEGATATEPTAPTLEGCTFLGWYLRDGTKYSFSTAVTENVTLYASWDVSTFTVSYNLNYENAAGVWTTETVNYGSTASEPTTPARDGYTFLGWYTINGAKYDFTSSVTSNITLYAQWEEIIETYTVTFRWNYENDPGVYLTTTVDEGSTVLEPTDPTRSGHTFLGWYTASGTLYDFSTPVTGNLVLYAQWS